MESGVFFIWKLSSSNNYAKFNLKVYYPSRYEWEIWYHQKAKIGNIKKTIDQFPWTTRFTNIDVNKKVNLFHKTIKNIIRKYIPHETITCDDRGPPWTNKDVKELIHEKNQACRSNHPNKNNISSVHQFDLLQLKLNSLLEKSKPTTTLGYLKNYQIPWSVQNPTGLY